MKAILGNKKKSDPIDAETIANLLRSNFFTIAYPYPKEMRATRDLLRRRHRLVRIRAEGYTHIHLICHQEGFADITSQAVKDKATLRELISRFSDLSLKKTIATDLDIIDMLDPYIK